MALSRPLKISGTLVCIALVLGSIFYLNQPDSARSEQSTDDAYVDADLSFIGARVAGTVSRVLVRENQRVKQGDVLFELDNKDFKLAVSQHQANVKQAEANLVRAKAALTQHASVLDQSQADVDAKLASLALAERDKKRFNNLAVDGAGSVQAKQKAQADESIARASLAKSKAVLAFNQAQQYVLEADLRQAKASLDVAKANLDSAKLSLSYTKILSPVDGIVGQKKVEVGEFVNRGASLAALVPAKGIYITANYRETQLANIREGQPVKIEVDALPGVIFEGAVDSVGPASQVSYSSIAPVNATGNFTKIVQRIPVRIRIENQSPQLEQLRVGMSVVPHIHTQ